MPLLRRAKAPYFRICDLHFTYATRLSAGGVADEWVTQLLRQGDATVFKKYSEMKREALQKTNRHANESNGSFDTKRPIMVEFCYGFATVGPALTIFAPRRGVRRVKKCFRMKRAANVGA